MLSSSALASKYKGIRFDEPNQLRIKFSQELSVSEMSELESIISNYSPDPMKSFVVSIINIEFNSFLLYLILYIRDNLSSWEEHSDER